jgi:hypothetical protein
MTAQTRWQELKKTVTIIIEVATLLDKNGIDVYFLNRPGLRNVSDPQLIASSFEPAPNGFTPLTRTIAQAISDKQESLIEKKLLIIVATDGEPTNDIGETEGEIKKMKHMLKYDRTPRDKIFTTILACTDQSSIMDYLDRWDKKLPNLDVVDDYCSEKQKIQKVQGKSFKFSFGDYVVKALLGSIDKSIDSLDEKKIRTGANSKKMCSIM